MVGEQLLDEGGLAGWDTTRRGEQVGKDGQVGGGGGVFGVAEGVEGDEGDFGEGWDGGGLEEGLNVL